MQAIEKLKLDNESPLPGVRPKGMGMESCVGTEYVPFSSPLPLESKVGLRCTNTKPIASHLPQHSIAQLAPPLGHFPCSTRLWYPGTCCKTLTHA